MSRYAIAPPPGSEHDLSSSNQFGSRVLLTRGFGTARGYPGNRHRWRDRPATTWTSCLRGFRKRKITAWSLKHLRRGAVVDSDEMPISGRQRKPATSTQTRTGAITRCSGNLALPLDNTCHGWGPLYMLLYHPECSDRVSLGYRFAAMVPRLAYVALWTPPLSHFPVTLAKTHSQAGRPYREASELLQGQNTQNN